MKVAITGCNSTLARSLISTLCATSYIESIVGIDLLPYRGMNDSRIHFVQADIRNFDMLCPILNGCDAVFHLAFIVLPTVPDLTTIFDINIRGSRNVFQAAATVGIKHIIYTSSIAAYGFVPSIPELISENFPIQGQYNTGFYYPYTKAIVERELDQFEKKHPEILITRLRPHIILGPNFVKYTDNFSGIFKQLESSSRIVWGIAHCNKNRPQMQLTHEIDLVNFMMFALKDRIGGIFNIAGKPIDLEEYLQKRGKILFNIPWKLVYICARIASYFNKGSYIRLPWLLGAKYQLIMDCSKINQTTYPYPIHSTQEIIREVLILRKRHQ